MSSHAHIWPRRILAAGTAFSALVMTITLIASPVGALAAPPAAEAPTTPLIRLDVAIAPVWEGKTTHHETVLFLQSDGAPEASLLYAPVRITSVMSPDFQTTYQDGLDFTVDGRVLRLTKESRIPFVTSEQMYPAEKGSVAVTGRVGGGLLVMGIPDGKKFCQMQVAVTYDHDETGFGDYKLPVFAAETLPRTIAALREKKPLTIVLYGDSIANGAETSGFWKVPPFMPSWGELVRRALSKQYGTTIEYFNMSKGGTASDWGREQADERVASKNPDLVLIAFGMGDAHATKKVPNETYKANLQAIIDTVRKRNAECEFILVGTMLANPESSGFSGNQAGYLVPLKELVAENKGVALADVTSAHAFMLTRKKFWDMSGNGVNHPSDFLARVYAQVLLKLLVE
ncbi:MAG: SGNH/GDSL hydrolase family protein [Planctomycetota bacterium]